MFGMKVQMVGGRGTVRGAFARIGMVLALAPVIGIGAVVAMPSTALAESTVGGWSINGAADCYMARDTGYVSVSVQGPTNTTNGRYFVAEIWVRGELESYWTRLQRTQTGIIYPWTRTSSGGLINTPVNIMSTSFTARIPGRFDIGVQYWTAAPGATTWSGPFFFQLKYDAQSSVTTYDKWGYAYLSIKDCTI